MTLYDIVHSATRNASPSTYISKKLSEAAASADARMNKNIGAKRNAANSARAAIDYSVNTALQAERFLADVGLLGAHAFGRRALSFSANVPAWGPVAARTTTGFAGLADAISYVVDGQVIDPLLKNSQGSKGNGWLLLPAMAARAASMYFLEVPRLFNTAVRLGVALTVGVSLSALLLTYRLGNAAFGKADNNNGTPAVEQQVQGAANAVTNAANQAVDEAKKELNHSDANETAPVAAPSESAPVAPKVTEAPQEEKLPAAPNNDATTTQDAPTAAPVAVGDESSEPSKYAAPLEAKIEEIAEENKSDLEKLPKAS